MKAVQKLAVGILIYILIGCGIAFVAPETGGLSYWEGVTTSLTVVTLWPFLLIGQLLNPNLNR